MSDDPTPAQAAALASQQANQPKAPGGKKKQKGQKIDLGAFLAATPGGSSWADEVDDLALPTGPAHRPDDGGAGGQLGGGFARMGYGGGDRMQVTREEIPMPTQPPYTAFVGSLSFDATESDLADLFGGYDAIVSVRIVSDAIDNKPKGFAYVEFVKREGLEAALTQSGINVAGRPIRVSVAAPPKSRAGGFGDRDGARGGTRMFDDDGRDEGRSLGDWTRSGPLPPIEGRSGSGFRPAPDRSASGGFDRPPREVVPERDNDWGAARGGLFKATEPQQRTPSSGGFDRRGSGFMPAPGGAEGDRRGPLSPIEPSKADSENQWRRPSVPSPANRTPSGSTPGSPSMGGRRKLELAPRGSTTSPSNDSTPPTPSSTKPSPFGNAAPVNTAERERQVEERLAAQRAAAATAGPPSRSTSHSNMRERDPPSRTVSQTGSARAPLSRTISDSTASSPPPVSSSSGPKVDPFGNAKPIDTAAKEREAESKIAASLASAAPGPRSRQTSTTNSSSVVTAPTAATAAETPATPASPTTATANSGSKPGSSPTQSLRKEGFSYSKMAGGSKATPPPAPQSNGNADGSEGVATKEEVAAPSEEMAKVSVKDDE